MSSKDDSQVEKPAPKPPRCSICGNHMENEQCGFMKRMMENFLYPCSYQKYGCRKSMVKEELPSHVEECRYKLYTCPFRLINMCGSFLGDDVELVDHLQIVHSRNHRRRIPLCSDAINLIPNPNIQNYQIIDKTAWWMSTNVRIFDNRMFVFNMYHVHNIYHRAHFFLVRIVGTKADGAKYQYKVTFQGSMGKKTYMGAVQSMHEDAVEIYHSKRSLTFDCLTISTFTVRTFENHVGKSEHIYCDLEITHKDIPSLV